MNDRKRERVAKAICRAAGIENTSGYCIVCESREAPEPCMWQSFLKEADAAMKAMKGF
jgi:hypothetical protein